jgi:hypothetical protein
MASMSILDDAIREHLELKRAHGADEAEVKRLEDEAFGPPGRPNDADPLAEAPTEFLGTPPFDAAEVGEEPAGRRAPNITDLQEAPPAPQEEEPAAEAEAAPDAPAGDAPPEPPADEQQPAMEHQTIPVPHPEPPVEAPEPEAAEEEPPAAAEEAPSEEPVADAGPSTEEREAIADQPTEFFDVEAELQADAPDTAEKPSPTDEQLLDSQLAEPRLAPPEPVTPAEPFEPAEELEAADEQPSDEYEEDDEFFSEQRLSEELHQALDAPVTDEHEALPEHQPFAEPEPEDEPETPAPPPAARVEEPTAIYDVEGDDEGEEPNAYEPETGSHDDVLEDTPDFLEESPEDDDLWFEQRPPKDFDFDD